MSEGEKHSAIRRLGAMTLLFSACALVWEVLAAQGPSSPFYIGTLEAPVAELRSAAFTLGVLLFLTAALLERSEASSPRWLVVVLLASSVLFLAALTYGAARGMMALQVMDPRLDAQLLFVVKAVSFGGLLVSFLVLARGAFRRP